MTWKKSMMTLTNFVRDNNCGALNGSSS